MDVCLADGLSKLLLNSEKLQYGHSSCRLLEFGVYCHVSGNSKWKSIDSYKEIIGIK